MKNWVARCSRYLLLRSAARAAHALAAWPWFDPRGASASSAKNVRRLLSGAPSSLSDTQQLHSAPVERQGVLARKATRVRDLVHLDEFSRRLHSCASGTELADTVARCAQVIFPDCHGALFLRADPDRFGLGLAWGGSTPTQSLQTLDCHALHSGRAYASHSASATACAHAKDAGHYVCIPLQTPSGLLGLLYLAHLCMPNTHRTPPWAATAIAERTSIALAAWQRQTQLQRRSVLSATWQDVAGDAKTRRSDTLRSQVCRPKPGRNGGAQDQVAPADGLIAPRRIALVRGL